MGLFSVSFHFRTTDDRALSTAVNERGVSQYRVMPAQGEWISFYEEQASQQDEERIGELAGSLSADLHCAAIVFLVHDSDIACYWLFDNGQPIDEYNSFPDYFDASDAGDEPRGPSGGQPRTLMRFCRTGITQDDLAAILATEKTFAEDVIAQLAEALGINPERALTDYRHITDGDGPDDFGGWDDDGDGGDDDDDDGGGGWNALPVPLRSAMGGRLNKLLGSDPVSTKADPQVMTLVQAAAEDDTDEIDRLLSEHVPVDGEAPAPLSGGQSMAGLTQLIAGAVPRIPMTPLLAAVVHKRRRAAERLLDGGAGLERVHPLFGTPVHAATAIGEVALLQLLIDRGGDVNARNGQGQTPLQLVAAGRATMERLAQAQAMIKSLGVGVPRIVAQLSSVALPPEGWDACERLLKARGAR